MVEIKKIRHAWRQKFYLTLVFFSFGPLMIGTGILMPLFPITCPQEYYETSFSGSITGRLTLTSPLITKSLGYCNEIQILCRNQDNYTIQILDENQNSYANLSNPVEIQQFCLPHFFLILELKNYTLQALRQTTDQNVSLHVTARHHVPPPPCMEPSYIGIKVLLIMGGSILIILGAYLVSKLTRLLDQL